MSASFLTAAGWQGAEIRPVAGDASARSYHRLIRADGARALLVTTPTEEEQIRFQRTCALFARAGVNVPEILAADDAARLMLVGDFGDVSFKAALSAGVPPTELYGTAVDLLAAWHARPAPSVGLKRYDADELLRQMALFTEHYLPALGVSDAGFTQAWRACLPLVEIGPPVLIHRDFHVENLFWLPERTGTDRCGVIDFQDAALAPAPYDLVSLLKDARRAPLAIEQQMIARYLRLSGLEAEPFRAAYALVGAVRNTRILGIFVRLAKLGKAGYLDYVDTCWAHLEDGLTDPALTPVRDWMDKSIPKSKRNREALS